MCACCDEGLLGPGNLALRGTCFLRLPRIRIYSSSWIYLTATSTILTFCLASSGYSSSIENHFQGA